MPTKNVGLPGQSFFGYAGFAFESDGQYGQGATPEVYCDLVSDGFSGDNGVQYLNTIRSRGRYEGTAGAYEDSGEVEFPAAPENGLGYMLKGALGETSVSTTDTDTDGTADYGTHTFTTSPTLPSMSIELGLGQIQPVQHVGVGVNTLELSHAAEEYLMVTFELPAKEPQLQNQDASPTYSDLRPFIYHDGSITLNGTDRSGDLSELTVSLENNIEGQYRAQRTFQHMTVGERAITGEVSLDFANDTIWHQFLGGNQATEPQKMLFEGSLHAEWLSPEKIGTTTQGYKLSVDMPRVVIESHESNMNENDLIMENVTYGALQGKDGAPQMTMELTNSRTSSY